MIGLVFGVFSALFITAYSNIDNDRTVCLILNKMFCLFLFWLITLIFGSWIC